MPNNYTGPPTPDTIRYIQRRFAWDADNEFGFGCGVIIDSLSARPALEPLDWRKFQAA